MFKHEKILFHPVEVERPNPQYAVLLQEQLGGGNGELKAAMQYMSQSFRIKDPEIKDLFLDIAAEELGHMEMVAQTINMLNGHVIRCPRVSRGIDESGIKTEQNVSLHLARLHLGGIHIVPVEQIDGLRNHLHVPQLLGSYIKKEILDLGILDPEAL